MFHLYGLGLRQYNTGCLQQWKICHSGRRRSPYEGRQGGSLLLVHQGILEFQAGWEGKGYAPGGILS